VLIGLAISVVLISHLLNAGPMRARTAVAIGLTIPTVALAATLWVHVHTQERSPGYIDDRDRIVPPALLWRRGVPLDSFTTELKQLRVRVDEKRRFVEREDPTPDEDETDD
jgi:hypothetical protein